MRPFLSRCHPQNAVYILLDNAVFLHPLFRFAVLFIQPFLFLGQPFVLGFQGVQIGELFHALFFQGLCRSFMQNESVISFAGYASGVVSAVPLAVLSWIAKTAWKKIRGNIGGFLTVSSN